MRNGTPSLRASSVAAASRGSSSPTMSRAIVLTSSASRACRMTASAARRATRVSASEVPAVSTPVRNVATMATADSEMLSARYSMTASDSASAHCRSSTTKTTGASGRASAWRRRRTPSPRTSVEGSASAPETVDHSGTTRARVGRNVRIDSGGRMPARAALSRASRTGRSGVSAEVALHRPTSTIPPRPRAHAASSRTRRLFPMPAGPSTIVALPPLLAAPRSASSSRSRPIIGRARADLKRGTSVKPTQSHAPQRPSAPGLEERQVTSVRERLPGHAHRHADCDVVWRTTDDIRDQPHAFVEVDERDGVRSVVAERRRGSMVNDDCVHDAVARSGTELESVAEASRARDPRVVHGLLAVEAPLQHELLRAGALPVGRARLARLGLESTDGRSQRVPPSRARSWTCTTG